MTIQLSVIEMRSMSKIVFMNSLSVKREYWFEFVLYFFPFFILFFGSNFFSNPSQIFVFLDGSGNIER